MLVGMRHRPRGEWLWRSGQVVTRQISTATSSLDRDALEPSAADPQVVAGRGGHAQDVEGAEPASGTGLPGLPAVVRADAGWSSTGATLIPWTDSPGTKTCRTWSRGGGSTAPSGLRVTSGSGTRHSASGPGNTRPSTATCRSSAWRQPPLDLPAAARATRQPRASAPAPPTSRPLRQSTRPSSRDSDRASCIRRLVIDQEARPVYRTGPATGSAWPARPGPTALVRLQGATGVRLLWIQVSEPSTVVAIVSASGAIPRAQVALHRRQPGPDQRARDLARPPPRRHYLGRR